MTHRSGWSDLLGGLGLLLPMLALMSAIMSWSAPAGAGTTIIKQNANGGAPALVPRALPPENPAWISCNNTTVGVAPPGLGYAMQCDLVTAPVHQLRDGSGVSPAETCEVLDADYGLELSQPDPGNHICMHSVSSDLRPAYSALEASSFALTPTVPGTLNTTYTEGASYLHKTSDAYIRYPGQPYVFKCTAITLGGTKYYCSFAGGAGTTTQDNAEMRIGKACSHIRTIAPTWYDSAGNTRSALPGGCAPTIGISNDNTDTGALITVTTASASSTQAAASNSGWTTTHEVSLWVNGSCSSATRALYVSVICD